MLPAEIDLLSFPRETTSLGPSRILRRITKQIFKKLLLCVSKPTLNFVSWRGITDYCISPGSLILLPDQAPWYFTDFCLEESSGFKFVPKMHVLSGLRTKLVQYYSVNGPRRANVPTAKIDWAVEFKEYRPPHYTSVSSPNKPGVDEGDVAPPPKYKFNCMDGEVNRTSFHGTYLLDRNGCPLNPAGRTGLSGRGVLGKWGPNHAADTIVTRPLKDEGGSFVTKLGKPVFQFIGIQRRDTGEWAIPGGKIEAGETALTAAKREFFEEVFSIENASVKEKLELEKNFAKLFSGPHDIVYKGYVDDPRSTDNAWMETQVIHLHAGNAELQNLLNSVKFKAGSDAKTANWVPVSESMELFASHKSFLKIIAEKNGWFW